MQEIIDKLTNTLQEIEGYHGIVHNASSYDHVKQLHQQTRNHLAELRKSVQELFQQATPIIQAVAGSELVYNDNSGYCDCHYCTLSGVTFDNRRAMIKSADHDTDCPIRLAAAWLEQYSRKADE